MLPEKDKTLKICEWHNHALNLNFGYCNNMPLFCPFRALRQEHLMANDMQDLSSVFVWPATSEAKFSALPLAVRKLWLHHLSECKDKRNWVTEISL